MLHDLNQARSSARGVNAKPLPSGNITVHSNGNLTLQAANGGHYALRPNGGIASYSADGNMVTFPPTGRISTIRTANLHIRRGVRGELTVKTFRRDGRLLVSAGAGRGYLERSSVYAGHTVVTRTYFAAGHTYNRTMINYSYGVVSLPRYVPEVYFAPAFCGWMYYRWAASMQYA